MDYLQAKGFLFHMKESLPSATENLKGYTAALLARDQAKGVIRSSLSPELRSAAGPDGTDALAMLALLKKAFGASDYGSRFNALRAFLTIHAEAGETAAAFIARAREALRVVQAARPAAFDVVQMDKELLMEVLLSGSGNPTLITSLLAQNDLDVTKIENALKNDEQHLSGAAAAAEHRFGAPRTFSAPPCVLSLRLWLYRRLHLLRRGAPSYREVLSLPGGAEERFC